MENAQNERPVMLGASFPYAPRGTAVYHAIVTLALYAVLVNRCINASYGPVQQHQHYSNVVQRVEARAMTWDSVVSSSDLVMLPSMRPRMRSTAVGAVQSRRESMVVSGICR